MTSKFILNPFKMHGFSGGDHEDLNCHLLQLAIRLCNDRIPYHSINTCMYKPHITLHLYVSMQGVSYMYVIHEYNLTAVFSIIHFTRISQLGYCCTPILQQRKYICHQ